MANTNDLLNSIDDFLSSVGHGSQKTAGATGMGQSSHPSASASLDDGLQKATEGARSSENEQDNKEEQPVGVEHATEGMPGGQESTNVNIGPRQAATGEDAAAERDYKTTKDDPGTSHPAEAGKEKYAAASYSELLKVAADLGSQVCSDVDQLVRLAYGQSQQPQEQKQAQASPEEVKQAEYVQLKQAADEHAVSTVYAALYQGHALAIKVADHLDALASQEMGGGETADAGLDPMMAAGAEAEGGGMPPEAGAGGGEGGVDLSQFGSPEEIQALLQALLAGQNMGGEEAAEQMAGGEGLPPMEGGEEGMPPEGGELPPEQADEAAMLGDVLQGQGQDVEGLEVAASCNLEPKYRQAVKQASENSKHNAYICKSKQASEKYAKMRNYVTEVFQRSQR